VSSSRVPKQLGLRFPEEGSVQIAFSSRLRTAKRAGGSRSKSRGSLSSSKLSAQELAWLFGTSGYLNSPSVDVRTTTSCSGSLAVTESESPIRARSGRTE